MEIRDAVSLFLQHLQVEKGVSKATIENYKEDLKLFFDYFKDTNNTDDLMIQQIAEFIQIQSEDNKAASTILRRYSASLITASRKQIKPSSSTSPLSWLRNI